MSEQKREMGTIGWTDLTVDNADEVRDFYREVVGWQVAEVDMGEYSDYSMETPESGTPTAGVCHARGVNAGLPAQWLLYILVADLDWSIERLQALGGEVVAGPRKMGGAGRYCVFKDPAGAAAALFEPAE